ncbi:hybrid sensor histidine kinase/response regulator [Marinilabiliaceae bacterium JC017]|nr:hybrid sensor histidine kinase/response regulator [Marinilabiliaceae bacterium JC017]
MKRIFITILSIIPFCVFATKIENEQSRLKNYTINEGLPNNTILSIVRGNNGILWSVSPKELIRFDGYDFKSFQPTFNLSETSFRSIHNDGNELLVNNGDQLLSYSPIHNQWKRKFSPPISGRINCVEIKPKKTIFCSIGSTLCQHNEVSGTTQFSQFTTEITNLRLINDSSLLVTDTNTLYIIDDQTLELKHTSTINDIQCLTISDTTIYVGTAHGVVCLNAYYTSSPIKTLNGLHVLNMEKSGHQLWINTKKNGLIIFDLLHKEVVPADLIKQVTNANIKCIHHDSLNNTWIGTQYGGLYQVSTSQKRFQHLHPGNLNGLTDGTIIGFSEIEDLGILILSPHNVFLWQRHTNSAFPLNIDQGIKDIHFKGIVVDGIYTYIYSSHGIWKVDQTLQLHQIPSTASMDISALERRQNGIWLIGTEANEFIQADASFNILSRIVPGKMRADTSPPIHILSIIETSEKEIYLAAENGLFRFVENQLTFQACLPQNKKGPSSLVINCLHEAINSQLWLGTNKGGLVSYDITNDHFTNYNEAKGFNAKSVFAILESPEDVFWLGTDNGLIRFDKQKNYFTPFNTAEGIQGNQFSPNAFTRLTSGEILAGGTNGFNLFDPSRFKTINHKIPVIISEISINNESFLPGVSSLMNLNYQQNDIIVSYALPDFSNTGKNSYAIRLKPMDKEWVMMKNKHTVAFNNLAPGNYTLEIRGWNNNNQEGIPTSLAFAIKPPWWKTSWAFLFYALFIIATAGAVTWFLLMRFRLRNELRIETLKRKQSEEMINFKLNFFTNVSHEIRTPLTLIASPVQQLRKLMGQNKAAQKQIEILDKNTNRLMQLLEQLLDFRKLQSNKTPFNSRNLDIVGFINDLTTAFSGLTQSKGVTITTEIPFEKLITAFDTDKMEKILYNLLSNAVKHVPQQNGIIKISLERREETIIIRVDDNGPGVDITMEDKLFQPFESKGGFGIGLALTQELVKLHEGQISYSKSSLGGSCFKINLPIKSKETLSSLPATTVTNNTAVEGNKKLPGILIVEDNRELCQQIAALFAPIAQVQMAFNGREALIKLEKFDAQLVISDVMMPEMDGLALCSAIKSNLGTSHIPVVLLTAYSDIQHQLKGAEAGADLYIRKPFNNDLLVSKVMNQISIRQKLREKYITSASAKTEEIVHTSLDKKFVDALTSCIETNLDNPDLGVDLLADHVSLSRSQLTRKLTNITGLPPGQFITNFRLKQAAELLKSTGLNISEIAYKTGFSDPKYFSRSFKKMFGTSPSNYR